MRMIDADRLEKDLKNTSIRIAADKGKMFELIKDAPTLGSDCQKCAKVKTCKHVLGHPATITRINCPLWRAKV